MDFLAYLVATSLFNFSLSYLINIQPDNPQIDFTFYAKLLPLYSQFHLIFHIDNHTQNIINNFFLLHPVLNTVFNYDTCKLVKRPISKKCLNVVYFDDPLRISTFLKHNENVYSADVVIFLTGAAAFDIIAKNYQNIPNLSKSGRVIIINYTQMVEIYVINFYSGVDSGLKLLETLTHDGISKLSKEFLPRKFEDFNKHPLTVGYVDYFPYIYCVRKRIIEDVVFCEEAVGTEYELLKILSESLNFEYRLIQAPNSSYLLLFDGLISAKYDFAIGGLSITPHRLEVFQFSNVIKFEDVALICNYEKSNLPKPTLFRLFSLKVELLLVVMNLLVAFLIFWAIKIFRRKLKISFSQIFRDFTRAIFEQPIRRKFALKTISTFIIWTSWWTFWTIMNISRKSRLTSLLLRKPKIQVSLTQLLNSGLSVVMDHPITQVFLDLFTKDDQTLILNSFIIQTRNICEVVHYMMEKHALIVGEVSRNLYHSQVFCQKTIYKSFNEMDYFLAQKFHVTPFGWPFKPGAPFVRAFNTKMKEALDGGLVKIWEEELLFNKGLNVFLDKNFNDGHGKVDFDTFATNMVMFIILMGGCIGCFLIEVLYYRWQKRKERRRKVIIMKSNNKK